MTDWKAYRMHRQSTGKKLRYRHLSKARSVGHSLGLTPYKCPQCDLWHLTSQMK